jgi:hypothetical protein
MPDGGAGSAFLAAPSACSGEPLVAIASSHQAAPGKAALGIFAALGAGILWGTMYIPYRKAYLTGMNPLSFITFFTVGELITMTVLAVTYRGALPLWHELVGARSILFWLMLGGFVWVLGDLFQQYATKYVGISRGIPLSNTNQLWDCYGASSYSMNYAAQATRSTHKSPEDRCVWPWARSQSRCPPQMNASTHHGRTPPIAKVSAIAWKESTSARASKAEQ